MTGGTRLEMVQVRAISRPAGEPMVVNLVAVGIAGDRVVIETSTIGRGKHGMPVELFVELEDGYALTGKIIRTLTYEEIPEAA